MQKIIKLAKGQEARSGSVADWRENFLKWTGIFTVIFVSLVTGVLS